MFVMMVTSGWGPETQRLGELCGYLSRRRNICSSVLGPVAGTSAANFYSCVTQTCTTCNNQEASNTIRHKHCSVFSTPLASSTDIVQMCRSSKQQLKGGVATHDGQSVCQIAGHCAAVTRPSRVTRSPASSRHVTHSAAAGKWRLMFILHPHLGPPLLPAGALHNRRPGGGQEAARSC